MANYVKVTRALELIMGISVPNYSLASPITTSNFTAAILTATSQNNGNGLFNSEVVSALNAAVPILNGIAASQNIPNIFNYRSSTAPLNLAGGKSQLVTRSVWQFYLPSRLCADRVDSIASWTSTGSGLTRPTRLLAPSALLDMMTIFTTTSEVSLTRTRTHTCRASAVSVPLADICETLTDHCGCKT